MWKTLLTALLCLIWGSAAVAADFYEGVKVGGVRYGYSNVYKNDQIGLGYLLGYSFNKNLAVEIEYNLLGGAETATDRYKGYATALNAVAMIPLHSKFSIYGKLGLASTTLKDYVKSGAISDATYRNTGVTGGFGGQYNVTDTVGIRAEYGSYRVGDSRSGTAIAEMFNVGGVFKF
ncbi:MAG: outer membrane beta-barrel protein [Pseudomonadota bacterium]